MLKEIERLIEKFGEDKFLYSQEIYLNILDGVRARH